ncbi:MAG TPA: glycosyltransferase [Acidimicrobiales bacterium]|jgi:UDP-N-acetylglucosamine--N-acetylmuramyl-(pentapeptide) pyrophosphoryl-undecaprenol N-acetylglucosamine transferase|nr:glycosyltransferase [Acidimicrobiales bacterium]
MTGRSTPWRRDEELAASASGTGEHGPGATLLVCSGGGHLKQLWLLRDRLLPRPGHCVWMTFDTPLSRSLLAEEDVVFLDYAAPRNLAKVVTNALLTRQLLRRVPVTQVVSTGANPALSAFLAARVRGITCHFIESATRSDGPSASGKLARWIPGTHLYTQHPEQARGPWAYRGSVFDSFSVRPGNRRSSSLRKVVVTVGTTESYGFRSLLERTLEILPSGCEVLWQTGSTDVSGLPIQARPHMPVAELEEAMAGADAVICHAGTGSALSALEAGRCPVLVYREAARGEHVDDHQRQTAQRLSRAGLAVAVSVEELGIDAVNEAASRQVSYEEAPPFVLAGG